MKVLLDENLPHELRHHLAKHDPFTVHYMGWTGVKNGALLSKAAGADFDVMLTMDNGVPNQQNVAALPVALVIISAPSNDMEDLAPLVPKILKVLSAVQPKTIAYVKK
ncbi:MAG TPA: hypothetical protein VG722_08625 [Tepidisphaeraceae bacterium]|nr:hypothetical protein [Tepidisphaeraceae bacterium]